MFKSIGTPLKILSLFTYNLGEMFIHWLGCTSNPKKIMGYELNK